MRRRICVPRSDSCCLGESIHVLDEHRCAIRKYSSSQCKQRVAFVSSYFCSNVAHRCSQLGRL